MEGDGYPALKIPFKFLSRFKCEPFGPLDNLEDYDLVVGKGSYNQITESLLYGTPYACSHFLGHWERENARRSPECAHVMDWSRDVAIPARETIKQMKLEQTQLRNDLFQNPANIEATLADILHAQCHEKIDSSLMQRMYDFSGKNVEKKKAYLKSLYFLRKVTLKAVFSLVYSGIALAVAVKEENKIISCMVASQHVL